jgi:hypothetical protein
MLFWLKIAFCGLGHLRLQMALLNLLARSEREKHSQIEWLRSILLLSSIIDFA